MNVAPGGDPAANESKPAEKRVCAGCVGEEYLKRLVLSSGEDALCNYCGAKAKTIAVKELADRTERAFEAHYERTPAEPDAIESSMLSDPESNYDWERRGEEVQYAIEQTARIEPEIARDVLAVLSERHQDRGYDEPHDECDFDEGAHYALKKHGAGDFNKKWIDFELSIKRKRASSLARQERLSPTYLPSSTRTRRSTAVR